MGEKRKLTVIEIGGPSEHPFHFPGLLDLVPDIRLDLREGTQDYLDLVHDEVGEVVFVSLSVQKRTTVSRGCFLKIPTDRGKLEHPVAISQHRPVKERSGSAAVSILEWVVPS